MKNSLYIAWPSFHNDFYFPGSFPQGCTAFKPISSNIEREESGIKDDSGMQDVQYTEVSFRWGGGGGDRWKVEYGHFVLHLYQISNTREKNHVFYDDSGMRDVQYLVWLYINLKNMFKFVLLF